MAAAPVVTTRAGKLRGRRTERGTLEFRGVHYAEPPVGERYLLGPVPVEAWDGVRDAVANAASPAQPELNIPGFGPTVPGDDYLNMNIFTLDIGAQGLPVFVWFCVGGFVICNNAAPGTDGGAFARDGVVAVTVNHRIGAEGFALIEDAPDNRGALDWLMCLEWVQDNIAAFGGDPGNVTIGGCSAGGATCHDLIAMDRARGLFHKAIPLSGPPSSGHRVSQEARNRRFAEQLDVPMTRAGLAPVPPDTLVKTAMAVGMPFPPIAVSVVEQNVGQVPDWIPFLPVFRPVIDGELLTADPIDVYRSGGGGHVDVLLAATRHEVDGAAMGEVPEDDLSTAFARMGIEGADLDRYRHHHPELNGGGLVGQAVTDALLRLWSVRAGDARATHHPGHTWAYEFAFPPASHGQDVAYLWDTVGAGGGDVPEGAQEVADALHGAAVRFMKDGAPGWPAYDVDTRAFMVFDRRSEVVEDPLRFERELWADVRG